MNTIFKTLILLSACSFCLTQYLPWGNVAINTYLTGPTVTKYYTWWNNTIAAYAVNAPYLNSCYVDIRNSSSATVGCTANCSQNDNNGGTCGSNCYPYVSPANFLQLADDGDAAYGFVNGGNIIFNLSYNGDVGGSYGGGGTVYELTTLSSLYINSNCNEGITATGFTSTYGGTQLFAGIIQEIVALDLWYLESLQNCIANFPSASQATALYSDLYTEFYSVIISLFQAHATSSNPATTGPTLFHIFASPWAKGGRYNGVSYTAPQTIIFDDLLSNWVSGSGFTAPC